MVSRYVGCLAIGISHHCWYVKICKEMHVPTNYNWFLQGFLATLARADIFTDPL